MVMRLSFALLAFTLAACASSANPREGPMTTSIAGTRWAVAVEGAASDRPRLEFQPDGRVAGYSGCNSVSGTWKLEGDAVRLGPLIMTKRACPGARDEMERRFMQAVGGNARLSIVGGRLVAVGEGGARLEFSPDSSR